MMGVRIGVQIQWRWQVSLSRIKRSYAPSSLQRLRRVENLSPLMLSTYIVRNSYRPSSELIGYVVSRTTNQCYRSNPNSVPNGPEIKELSLKVFL